MQERGLRLSETDKQGFIEWVAQNWERAARWRRQHPFGPTLEDQFPEETAICSCCGHFEHRPGCCPRDKLVCMVAEPRTQQRLMEIIRTGDCPLGKFGGDP